MLILPNCWFNTYTHTLTFGCSHCFPKRKVILFRNVLLLHVTIHFKENAIRSSSNGPGWPKNNTILFPWHVATSSQKDVKGSSDEEIWGVFPHI